MNQDKHPIRRAAGPIALAVSSFIAAFSAAYAATPGDPLGPAFGVLAESSPQQILPSVARDANGDTVVVWVDRTTGSVFGRRFAADSSPLDGGFQISQPAASQTDSTPDVASDAAGDFIVTWRQSSGAIMARRYTADGAPAGVQFPVEAAGSPAALGAPSVAMGRAGDFVIGWQRANRVLIDNALLQLSSQQVVAQRYDRGGAPLGRVIVADTQPNLVIALERSILGTIIFTNADFVRGMAVDVAMDAAGDFILTWGSQPVIDVEVQPPGMGYGLPTLELFAGFNAIQARRYDQNGRAQGLGQTVRARPVFNNYYLASQPVVSMDDGGDYVVAWREAANFQRNGQPTPKLLAQRYSSSGLRRGGAIVVADPIGFFTPISIASDAIGDFVVSWNFDFFSANQGIFGQRISAAGDAVGPNFQVSGPNSDGGINSRVAMDPAGNFVVVWQRSGSASTSTVQVRSFAGP